jgi:septum formation protein
LAETPAEPPARRIPEDSAPASLILASRSPQRRAILEQLGIRFSPVVSDVEEREQGPAEEVAVENARRKAEAVAARQPGVLVLGADTVVSLEGRLYGKAQTPAQAGEMLRALSGRRHEVVGGLCLTGRGPTRTAVARTSVRFRALSNELIEWYLASGEWRERAGSYAIQGRGAALVAEIDGDYLNVVGLPVATLLELVPELVG